MTEGEISLYVDKYLDGDSIEYGIPVRLKPVIASDGQKQTRRKDPARKILNFVAPISGHGVGAQHFWIPTGDYDVEAVMPSGEQLLKEVTVGAVGVTPIGLAPTPSPNEWRSWSLFAGSRRPSTQQLAFENTGAKKSRTDLINDVEISVGSIATTLGGALAFDPRSWQDWFKYLHDRFRTTQTGSALPEPDVTIVGPTLGVDVTLEGGHDDLPLRVGLRSSGHPDPAAREVGSERLFVSLSLASETRVMSLPWPWRGADGGRPFIDILVTATRDGMAVQPALRDTRIGGAFAYLNSGRVHLAGDLLRGAYDLLVAKYENPLAAAVGGYVLLSTSESEQLRNWPDWLENLVRDFPHISDGSILRGKWLLQNGKKGNSAEVHNLFADAAEGTLPFFTTGVVWLIDGLRQTSEHCPTCAEHLKRIRAVARKMDLSQSFVAVTLAKRRPKDKEADRAPSADRSPGRDISEPEGIQNVANAVSNSVAYGPRTLTAGGE
jgi:hypothetical protein